MAQSIIRRMKRRAMKEQGKTFRERVTEAVRTGKPVKDVTFVEGGK